MAASLRGPHAFTAASTSRGMTFSLHLAVKPIIMDKKTKEKRETPIIDGDARPDMPIDPANDGKKQKKAPSENKFESERVSDINSLEDFKDAKNE